MNKYLVIDLETGFKEMHKRKGNAFYNKIVAAGYKTHDRLQAEMHSNTYDIINNIPIGTDILVGHNIKYDLLYLWGNEGLHYLLKKGLKIWDTMAVEYILTGQQSKYAKLRTLAVEKYGCKEREKKMEEYWKNGIDTMDIPKELVLEDVSNDVADTEVIYLAQLEKAKELGMEKLIELQMDAVLATTEMEYNGIMIAQDALNTNQQKLTDTSDQYLTELANVALPYWPIAAPFDSNSHDQLSILLFGGKLRQTYNLDVYDDNEQPVRFKSGERKGQIRTKQVEKDFGIKGFGIIPNIKWKTKKDGIYSTKDEVLQELLHYPLSADALTVVRLMLELRNSKKQISTYFENMKELIYEDGLIRPSFVHVETDTGRLSSKNPNLQNQPKSSDSLVKQHFVSRYPEGKLVCADYAQIEIVVQAQLSGDLRYIQDVLNGVDFHSKRLALKENIAYDEVIRKVKINAEPEWIEKRSKIKAFSFARAYGAGPTKIAAQTGLTETEIKELIKKEDIEYCGLKQYNDLLQEYVTHTANGSMTGYYKNPFGRRFYFTAEETPNWLQKKGIYHAFRPTQIKNYMVQGTATGDIVPFMVGHFWRTVAQHNKDKYLLINTVHDSVMLDCKPEYIETAKKDLKILENVQEIVYTHFKYLFDVPVKIDIKTGTTWYDCGV